MKRCTLQVTDNNCDTLQESQKVLEGATPLKVYTQATVNLTSSYAYSG